MNLVRVTAVVALTLVLVLVLYLPSAYPPGAFLAQMRTEHRLNTQLWGAEKAARIVDRSMALNEALTGASPVPRPAQAPPTDQMAEAVAQEMERVNRRFFSNPYFRAIDMLVLLATYRFYALLQWLPLEAFAIAALLLDGFVVRVLRSKQFEAHDPEWFAVHACGCMLVTCGAAVAFTVPIDISPQLLATLPIASAAFLSRAVANFHRNT